MPIRALLAFCALLLLSPFQPAPKPSANDPAYTSDGKLKFPSGYRDWTYLSTGIDMSYSERSMNMGSSTFDNIFVNPEAEKAFMETGTWPDKTVLVMETRMAETKGSINKAGHFQSAVMGYEVHVKDAKRFPGGWAFFGFDKPEAGTLVPFGADCYSCHQQHAAVDTTFVQFYPTLLEVAKQKGTLSAEYLKESAAN